MSRELTPQELALFQMDSDYLNAGIPVYGSRVAIWHEMNMPVLIYHTSNRGYVLTDLSDLPAATINQLAQQSEVHGMWYYLPQSVQQIVAERAEQVADLAEKAGKTAEEISQQIAKSLGITLHDLLAPVVDALLVPLVLVGVVLAVMYLPKPKKG